jgi:hypothetical protein
MRGQKSPSTRPTSGTWNTAQSQRRSSCPRTWCSLSHDDERFLDPLFLAAVVEQAEANADKTRRILDLYEQMKQDVPRTIRSQYAVHAIDALFGRPVFRAPDFVVRSRIPRDTALRILRALRQVGVVRDLRQGHGRRASVLVFPALLDITEGKR